MDLNYDENLCDNEFFKQLQKDHTILVDTAPLEGWIICVPRAGVLQKYEIKDPEFLLAHILISHDELPETHFTNLIGKNLKVFNKKIYVMNDSTGWDLEVNILFEEIFYTKDYLKYKVWCIESPLFLGNANDNSIVKSNGHGSTNNVAASNEINLYTIQSLNDCINFILNETNSKFILKKLDNLTKNFIKDYNNAVASDGAMRSLNQLKAKIKHFIKYCQDIIKTNRNINAKIKRDKYFLLNCDISIETYLINLLYEFVINEIVVIQFDEVIQFNKIIRNLSINLNIKNLNINKKFLNKITVIKIELTKINNYTNVLDKINLLKKIFFIINNNCNIMLDDLIPILVFAIIKSGITNWIANLIFLKEFYFSNCANGNGNDSNGNNYDYGDNNNCDNGLENYIITTLEAGILYIKSNCIKIQNYNFYASNDNKQVNYIFNKIIDCCNTKTPANGNENDIINFFKRNVTIKNMNLCHPLCDCSNCIIKLNDNLPSIDLCDMNGVTSLHLAAMLGYTKIVNLLIEFKANINANDERNFTPVHYASLNGHQNTLLLLLHAGANINAENFEKNTAIHLAALNGHENCLKALLYYADHMKIKIDINAQNSLGNTALHLSAKWGFINCCKSLLEYGADISTKNKFDKTACDVAHNSVIRNTLQDGFEIVSSENSLVKYDLTKSMHEINLIDKIINAISDNDTNLALYYLGLENLTNLNSDSLASPSSCHPLCSCDKCVPLTTNGYTAANSINRKININNTNTLGISPLHAAIYYNNYDMIKFLIELNADPIIKSRTGQTPLHFGCEMEKVKSCEIFLHEIKTATTPAVVNAIDDNGNTPMHLAVKVGNTKLVEVLLRYGPNLFVKNFKGETAIALAENLMKLNILEILKIFIDKN